MKVYSILLFLAIFLAQDCNNRTTNTDTPSSEDTSIDLRAKRVLIKMKKNPCFGKCPIYDITIDTDGYVEFNGQRFTDKLGKFSKKIPKFVVAGLYKEFEAIGFMEMPEKYPSKLHDLPKTSLTFHPDAKTERTVVGDSFRPEELLALDKKLTEIAMSDGWTLLEKKENSDNLPDYFIRDQIIAKFNPDIDIPTYILSHKQYGLDIKKRVAPKLDMWVLTFDTLKITPSDMLLLLKDADEVEQAEFNKQLNNRNGRN